MSLVALADTHAALWYLGADTRLSGRVKAFMDSAASNGQKIAISSITLVEMVYLIEKHRLASTTYKVMSDAIANPNHFYTEVPLNSAIVESMRDIPRDQVPDMPDRIIAATAVHLGVPILSRDRQIRSALLQTIW